MDRRSVTGLCSMIWKSVVYQVSPHNKHNLYPPPHQQKTLKVNVGSSAVVFSEVNHITLLFNSQDVLLYKCLEIFNVLKSIHYLLRASHPQITISVLILLI